MNALTTTAQRPPMPTAVKHKAVLARDLEAATSIADNDPLIPADECHAIVAEMERALRGCDAETATEHASLIVAAYGSKRPDDADAYARLISAVVCKCPPDLLPGLVDEVTRRHPRFLPTKGEVESVVTELRRKRSNAAIIAKTHLRAHEKRLAMAKPTESAEDRAAMVERLRQRFPGMFGIEPEGKDLTDDDLAERKAKALEGMEGAR